MLFPYFYQIKYLWPKRKHTFNTLNYAHTYVDFTKLGVGTVKSIYFSRNLVDLYKNVICKACLSV